MIVFGGRYDPEVWLAKGATYSLAGGWEALPNGPLVGRTEALGFGALGHAHVLFGAGCDGVLSSCNDAASLDLAGGTWSKLAVPTALSERDDVIGAFVESEDRFVAWGGIGSDRVTRNDGQLFAPQTQKWEAIPAPPGLALADGRIAFSIRGRFGVFGGLLSATTGAPTYTNDGALFDIANRTWSALPGGAPTGRVRAVATAGGREVLIFGGFRFEDDPVNPSHYLADGGILRVPER